MTEQLDLANITDQISKLLSESTASSSNEHRVACPARTARPMIVPGRWRPAPQAASGLRNVRSRKNGVDTHS